MNGEGVDRLDVFQESHGSKHGTLRWSRVGSLGKRWRQGQLSVKENSKVRMCIFIDVTYERHDVLYHRKSDCFSKNCLG